MDENEAATQRQVATPIFNVYRRGYDPEQVDRYVADQQRRLDDALYRASEAERRLAAAVGQLRELHRRVAVYESETRTAQPPSLDTLGERVQRILQEAWEGAYTLRQEAEREVNELRETTTAEATDLREAASREAAEIVEQATRHALAIRDETERRRHAYLQRIEQDRERAVSQITYLYDQRQDAIAELARLQTTVQAVVEEMARSPLGRPAPGVATAAASPATGGGSRTQKGQDDSTAAFSAGERAGRHSLSFGSDLPPEGAGSDLNAVGEVVSSRERVQVPSEEHSSPERRRAGTFDAETTETDVTEATRPNKRRTGLFDAEREGWT
jgi:cell division septum initiation protein DivIVA